MQKKYFLRASLLLALNLIISTAFAQTKLAQKSGLGDAARIQLTAMEDTMQTLANTMLLDTLVADSSLARLATQKKIDTLVQAVRLYENSSRDLAAQAKLDTLSQFWRVDAADKMSAIMSRALKIKGSFEYAFDRIPQLSILYPADRSFRIITWQLFGNAAYYKYYGVVQFANGKTVWLQDRKQTIRNANTKKLKADNWYGALYYRLFEYKNKSKTQYLVFGYDANSFFQHTKMIDVLNIDGNSVSFGAPIFDLRTEEVKKMEEEEQKINNGRPNYNLKPDEAQRYFMDYSADAAVSLRYDTDLNLITFDHLVPLGATKYGIKYMPDSDIDALKWENGKWTLKERIFRQISEEVPRPIPILDKRDDGITPQKHRTVPAGNPLDEKRP
ncbi:MAG: hypothetical protein RI894_404 [Bacteroidota bacterium]|jgi:hypothetical protein